MTRPEERPEHRPERELDWETEVDRAETTRPIAVTRGPADEPPSAADVAGEAVGGLAGVVTGAAIGSVAGPAGTLIGALAGALGGWWTGRAIAEAAETVTDEDEAWFRADYEAFGAESAGAVHGWSWERARPAYGLGRLAASHPEWSAREWVDVEPELRRGWTDDVAREHGDWPTARRFAAAGWTRGRAGPPPQAATARGD